jgi:cell division protein ZapA (FtsZ GTPase activity inhibitor)
MANTVKRAYPHWSTLYEAVLLELDLDKLPQRITEARHAVMDRMRALDGREWGSEREFLMNVLNVLRDLQKMVESVRVARNRGDTRHHPTPICRS